MKGLAFDLEISPVCWFFSIIKPSVQNHNIVLKIDDTSA